jgi:hypothetical protein
MPAMAQLSIQHQGLKGIDGWGHIFKPLAPGHQGQLDPFIDQQVFKVLDPPPIIGNAPNVISRRQFRQPVSNRPLIGRPSGGPR